MIVRAAFLAGLLLLPGQSAFALDLGDLEPDTRLIQTCDLESMKQIENGPGTLHPDRAMIDALSAATITGNTAKGEGAVRSDGKWFRFSFECTADAEHLRVKSFSFSLGDAIPRQQWERFGLFD